MSEEEYPAIVIDNGSYELKAGIGGDAPSCCFRAVVGRPRNNINLLNTQIYVGDEAQARRGILSLKQPIQYGIIQDWDGIENMEVIWNHLFFKELRVEPQDHPILLTESPMNPNTNKQRMIQILFEKFDVPSVQASNSAVLSLYASGRTTGIALDSGHGVSNIVPIYEGYSLQDATLRIDLAGRACTQNLISLWNEQEIPFTCSAEAEIEIARNIKEKLCYVALDYEKEMQKYKESGVNNRSYELPDGNEFVIQNQRFRCPELLFNPQLFGFKYLGLDIPSIHEFIKNSINKCDIDMRKDLYGNIVLAGGNTMFPGFPERLSKELTSIVPKMSIKVVAPPERKYSCWIGGSILSSLSTFQKMWITRKEYDESGPSIILKKKCQ